MSVHLKCRWREEKKKKNTKQEVTIEFCRSPQEKADAART